MECISRRYRCYAKLKIRELVFSACVRRVIDLNQTSVMHSDDVSGTFVVQDLNNATSRGFSGGIAVREGAPRAVEFHQTLAIQSPQTGDLLPKKGSLKGPSEYISLIRGNGSMGSSNVPSGATREAKTCEGRGCSSLAKIRRPSFGIY
jgi:hypothetical protein